jgi:hypothetical protein
LPGTVVSCELPSPPPRGSPGKPRARPMPAAPAPSPSERVGVAVSFAGGAEAGGAPCARERRGFGFRPGVPGRCGGAS